MIRQRGFLPVAGFGTALLLGACGGGSGEAVTTLPNLDVPEVSAAYCDLVRTTAQKVRDETAADAEITDAIRRLSDLAPPELEAEYRALVDAASRTGAVQPDDAATVQAAADRIQLVNNARCG